MAKELLLMADVDGLGVEGEIVRVAEGYARNFLLPRKMAAPVSPATRRLVEKKKAERIAREAATRQEAEEEAARLGKLTVTLAVKTGEGGKLYGSISAADILAALEKQGVTLSKKQLSLESPIRELGTADIPVKLHDDVQATLKVEVVEE